MFGSKTSKEDIEIISDDQIKTKTMLLLQNNVQMKYLSFNLVLIFVHNIKVLLLIFYNLFNTQFFCRFEKYPNLIKLSYVHYTRSKSTAPPFKWFCLVLFISLTFFENLNNQFQYHWIYSQLKWIPHDTDQGSNTSLVLLHTYLQSNVASRWYQLVSRMKTS